MIGFLRGVIIYKDNDSLLIDVSGVGYELFCTQTVLQNANLNAEAMIYTELVVREDLMQLLGFSSRFEREIYRLLNSVQGVGAKAAMAIMNNLGVAGVERALTLQDVAALRSAPGVGPKLASRIANELSEKAAKLSRLTNDTPNTASNAPNSSHAPLMESPIEPPEYNRQIVNEAVSALVNLGYDHVQSAQIVQKHYADHSALSSLIRASLRELSGGAT